MTDQLYSQNQEERVILEHVNKGGGRVLDIGAFDGRTNSNSLALIELGWEAILVEPSPTAFLKLLELHGGNPKVTLINAAVGNERRMTKFHEIPGDQCSSVLDNEERKARNEGKQVRTFWAAQVTPSNLLNEVGISADVLSIDCEGQSVDVLYACPIRPWGTSVIIVEHDQRCVELSGWGREHGFQVKDLNAENIVLVKR